MEEVKPFRAWRLDYERPGVVRVRGPALLTKAGVIRWGSPAGSQTRHVDDGDPD